MDTEKVLLTITKVENQEAVHESLVSINGGYLIKRTQGKCNSYRGLDPKYDGLYLDYLKNTEGGE